VSGGGKSEVEVGWHREKVGVANKGLKSTKESKEIDSPLLSERRLRKRACTTSIIFGKCSSVSILPSSKIEGPIHGSINA